MLAADHKYVLSIMVPEHLCMVQVGKQVQYEFLPLVCTDYTQSWTCMFITIIIRSRS